MFLRFLFDIVRMTFLNMLCAQFLAEKIHMAIEFVIAEFMIHYGATHKRKAYASMFLAREFRIAMAMPNYNENVSMHTLLKIGGIGRSP